MKELKQVKERLEIIVKNNDREIQKLQFKIKNVEWKLRYATTMCVYTKKDLEEMKENLKEKVSKNNELKWALGY